MCPSGDIEEMTLSISEDYATNNCSICHENILGINIEIVVELII